MGTTVTQLQVNFAIRRSVFNINIHEAKQPANITQQNVAFQITRPALAFSAAPTSITQTNWTVSQVTAGEALGATKAVYMSSGEAFLASGSNAAIAGTVLGITLAAYAHDETARVRTSGELTDSGLSLTPGGLVFVGTSGTLTQTKPTSGILCCLGFAMTATKIMIQIQPCIRLA